MTIVVTCTYRAGGADARMAIRDRHLEYVIAHLPQVRFAGALASDDDREAVGMLIAHATDDLDVARRFMADEPYHREGLFATVHYARLRQFIPHPTSPDFLVEELMRERRRLEAARTPAPCDPPGNGRASADAHGGDVSAS